MLCLPCTMLFVVSGENCLTSNTNGKKKGKPTEQRSKNKQLRQNKQRGGDVGSDKKRTKQNAEAEWRPCFVFFLLFLAFQWGCDGLITC